MAWSTPRTWVAGEKPSAATLNTHIRDNFAAIGDAWTSYTPTQGNMTLGNGALSCAYTQAGKLVSFRIKFTLGSTSTVGTGPTFTLPVTSIASRSFGGVVQFWDSSASAITLGFYFASGAGTLGLRTDASGTINSTTPFTWANGDEISMVGTYEAA